MRSTLQPFRFRKFELFQSDKVFKIGTDAVLFGAWIELSDAQSILDIGTGTGILSLMAAQRNPSAEILAIDLNPDAVQLAKQNFEVSPWSRRLEAQLADAGSWKAGKFDLVISNPPYFQGHLGSRSPVDRQARHAGSLTPRTLLFRAARLLNDNGRLAVIYPIELEPSLTDFAATLDLAPIRVLKVRSTIDKPLQRCLIEWGRGIERKEVREIVLFKDHNRSMTEEYRNLVAPFYL